MEIIDHLRLSFPKMLFRFISITFQRQRIQLLIDDHHSWSQAFPKKILLQESIDGKPQPFSSFLT